MGTQQYQQQVLERIRKTGEYERDSSKFYEELDSLIFFHGYRQILELATVAGYLSARQANVLRRRFDGASQREIGVDMGVTRAQVGRIEGMALRKLSGYVHRSVHTRMKSHV